MSCCRRRAWSCSSARRAPASRRGRHAHFAADQIVSSDRLRAVGRRERGRPRGQRRTRSRCSSRSSPTGSRRGLTTVIDTLGLDADRRASWLDARPARHGVPSSRVVFDDDRRRVPGPQPGARQAPSPTACSPASCAQLERAARRRSTRRGSTPCSTPATGARRARGTSPARRRRSPHGRRAHRSGCGSGCSSRASPGRAAPPDGRPGLRAIAAAAEAAGFTASG